MGDTNDSPERATSRTSDGRREETFAVTGALHVTITSRSGDITVRASRTNESRVTLSADSAKYHHLLQQARVDYDPTTRQLDVRTQPRDASAHGRPSKVRVSWFDFGGSDLDVTVVVPEGSSLEIKTVSGDVSLQGPLNAVTVSTVSGDVSVTNSCDTVDAHTASGDVSIDRVLKSLRCRCASGDVECHDTAATTEVMSASGDVDLTVAQPGRLEVKVVSGDIRVKVARGLVVDVNANTISGELSSNIDFGDYDGGDDEEQVFVKATTVSGDIRIDKTW
ncbi:MAG: DUF4097 family beta strand repeat-containing protein [Acidimicrobiales bacterium]|jgi:DUF4097 and DUF4098 domain-containing protein YvlB